MSFWDEVSALVESLTGRGALRIVCRTCVRPIVDKIISEAGDYALCERCRASITSKTGVRVLERSL